MPFDVKNILNDMAYNLKGGAQGALKWKDTIKYMSQGRYISAANEIGKSKSHGRYADDV